jgi:hypothetical protein
MTSSGGGDKLANLKHSAHLKLERVVIALGNVPSSWLSLRSSSVSDADQSPSGRLPLRWQLWASRCLSGGVQVRLECKQVEVCRAYECSQPRAQGQSRPRTYSKLGRLNNSIGTLPVKALPDTSSHDSEVIVAKP